MTTESANLTRLMSNARVRLPGALDDALKLELFSVMSEFFKNSNCWREETTFRTRATITDYEVLPESPGATINRLMWVINADDVVVPATMSEPGIIALRNEPTAVEQLRAVVALSVSDPVDSNDYPRFPTWVLAKYSTEILDGLLAHMMSQPAKPFTNERLSVYHMRRFRGAIGVARTEADHGNLYAAQAWRFPAFAGRR